MAFERLSDSKVISTNLDGFIQTNLTLLKNQRTQRNLDDETRFQTAVLEDNLSLADQLSYRQDQLKRVKTTYDKTEIARIKAEISGIKDRIEADSFTQEYIGKLNQLNSGASSLDTTISWLENRLAATTDASIKKNIQDNLQTLYSNRYTLQKATLSNQTDFAINDKSESILNTQIDKVSTARKDALLSGNDNYVAVLDLQLQNLKKAKSEATISKTLLDFSANTLTGQSAVSLLDSFDKQISQADTSTPITINGTRYDNAQQFWNTKRADYLNDRTTNGFFGRYQDEIVRNVDYQVSKGLFTTNSLKQVSDSYDGLRFRPELADFSTRIDQEKQTVMGKAADIRATQVLNKFATDLDAKKAVEDLSTIQDTYGIDQTKNYQTILLKASQEKSDQLNSLIQATSQLMAATPGLTKEQAFKKAVETGAGVTYSPEALATKPPEQLFADATKNPSGTTPPLTIDKNAEGKTFQKPNLVEGNIYQLPNSPTGYLFKNGQLQPLAGQFTNDELKAATGKGFNDMVVLDSFGNTPIGPNLDKTQVLPPNPAPTPAPGSEPNKPIVPGTVAPPAPAVAYDSYTVKAGDTLSKISQQYYQDPKKYQQIFDANKDTLKSPSLIKVGQTLKIPKI